MKNLLSVFAVSVFVLTACGPTEKEKAEAQDEAEEKVNEIMKDLEASQEEVAKMDVDTAVAPDSVATDTMMMKE